MSLFNILKKLGETVGKVQQQNKENPNEETAEGSVFDRIKDSIEDLKKKNEKEELQRQQSTVEELREKLKEVQIQNKENPVERTAPTSVFDRLNDALKEVEMETPTRSIDDIEVPQVEVPPINTTYVPPVTQVPSQAPSFAEEIALTNSSGGSLAIRIEPDMGSGILNIRIPESSRIRVLEYSDKTIHIDGQISKWVKVDFDGNIGWILDIYLNFN